MFDDQPVQALVEDKEKDDNKEAAMTEQNCMLRKPHKRMEFWERKRWLSGRKSWWTIESRDNQGNHGKYKTRWTNGNRKRHWRPQIRDYRSGK